METVARWNLRVSPEIDQSVRMLLAARGRARKGDLSGFVENAVREHIFQYALEQARNRMEGVADEEMEDLIAEAVTWARKAR